MKRAKRCDNCGKRRLQPKLFQLQKGLMICLKCESYGKRILPRVEEAALILELCSAMGIAT